MSWAYLHKLLTQGDAQPEEGDRYYRMVLKNFDSFDENIRLLIAEKIIRHAQDTGNEGLTPGYMPGTDGSMAIDEADNRELKKWLFKFLTVFSMGCVALYLMLAQVIDYVKNGNSSFLEVIKVLRVIIGI